MLCPTPGCGARLRTNAIACNDCGWEAPKRAAAVAESSSYNRCSWQFASERCAYIARVFPGAPPRGNGLCWDHHTCNDAVAGREIVAKSMREVPLDFDYSSANLVKLSRDAYLARTESRASSAEDVSERAAIQAESAVKAMP